MIKQIICDIINSRKSIAIPEFFIETCNEKINFHYCTNLLFKIRHLLEKSDIDYIIDELRKNDLFAKVEVVNNYINFSMSSKYFYQLFERLSKEEIADLGKGQLVNVEYCSINPTGFLHIGHARNAILGDSIACILKKVNYKVSKEYYVNDGGNQINLLASSILARYQQISDSSIPFIENGYVGDEIIDIAKRLKTDDYEEIKKIGVEYFIKNIKKDLKLMNIQHDSWVFESKIIEQNYIQKAFEILKEKNYIIEGVREEKQNEKGNNSKKPLLLLKTTEFGDEFDRPLTKEDGSWTYFAPDIGYHLNKIERGYRKLICVLGADHDSYAFRLKIAIKLLDDQVQHNTVICQMVSFEDNGNIVKFSKRKGNSLRVKDFLKVVEADVLRYMILDKNPNAFFVFDYEKALSLSLKNPVFYCHYAFARASSLMKNFTNQALHDIEVFEDGDIQNLLLQLEMFQDVLKKAAETYSPSLLTQYLKKLSEKLHKLWQSGKEDSSKRIITDNKAATYQKLLVIQLFTKTAQHVFDCLGITPKSFM